MNSTKLKILAIDTATEACSVALYLHGAVTQHLEASPNGHSKRVLGMAQNLLREAGLDLRELDALAVDVGPGSFTGLRIGIGVAQGLGYGAQLAVIPVGSLEALAYPVLRQGGAASALAAIDARMGQVYFGLYRTPDLHTLIEPTLSAPNAVAVGDAAEIVGVGSGWDSHAPALLETLNKSVTKWLPGQHPEAASVAQIAAARGLSNAVSPLRLSASYIRNEVAKTAAQIGEQRRAATIRRFPPPLKRPRGEAVRGNDMEWGIDK